MSSTADHLQITSTASTWTQQTGPKVAQQQYTHMGQLHHVNAHINITDTKDRVKQYDYIVSIQNMI